jgi:hypothetical protein
LFRRPFLSHVIDNATVQLTNRFLSVRLSRTGTFVDIHHREHDENIPFNTNVIRYGTSTQSERNSGAYLFLPDGDGKEIPMGQHDLIRIQHGPLISRIDILHEMYGLYYKLTHTNGRISCTNN